MFNAMNKRRGDGEKEDDCVASGEGEVVDRGKQAGRQAVREGRNEMRFSAPRVVGKCGEGSPETFARTHVPTTY